MLACFFGFGGKTGFSLARLRVFDPAVSYRRGLAYFSHQKTTLSDGFIIPVGFRPTASQVKVQLIYRKSHEISNRPIG